MLINTVLSIVLGSVLYSGLFAPFGIGCPAVFGPSPCSGFLPFSSI